MQTRLTMNYDHALAILAAARIHAENNGWKVSIAVVDDGGHLLAMSRLDNAAPMTASIAIAKANASALGRRETRAFEEMINKGRTAFLSVPQMEGMLEGGVPVMVGGQFVGAVGVSGVKPDEDVEIARAGIAAVPEAS